MEIERGMHRAKKIDNGEWVYGWKFISVTGRAYIMEMFDDRYSYPATLWHEVDLSTLGEYTGIQDKNGDPIFEGDIITLHQFLFDGREIESILTALVDYDHELACYGLSRIENDFYQDYTGYRRGEGSAPICFFHGLHEESFTRLGNKWDNPSLGGV